MSHSPTEEPKPDKPDDGKLQERMDELEKTVLSLARNAHTIMPPQKQEDFKRELTHLLEELEAKLRSLSQSGE